MARLLWGQAQQLCFMDEHEYYQALGSLCRPDAYLITFETNSDTNSWGDAFRIKCLNADLYVPDAFIFAMKTARRINCNDYVQYLYEYHAFDFDVANKVLVGQYSKVKATIPSLYYSDFDEGYNLKFTRYSKEEREANKKRRKSTSVPLSSQHVTATDAYGMSVGQSVVHQSWGKGKVTKLTSEYIYVKFGNEIKTYKYPDAIKMGSLKKFSHGDNL